MPAGSSEGTAEGTMARCAAYASLIIIGFVLLLVAGCSYVAGKLF